MQISASCNHLVFPPVASPPASCLDASVKPHLLIPQALTATFATLLWLHPTINPSLDSQDPALFTPFGRDVMPQGVFLHQMGFYFLELSSSPMLQCHVQSGGICSQLDRKLPTSSHCWWIFIVLPTQELPLHSCFTLGAVSLHPPTPLVGSGEVVDEDTPAPSANPRAGVGPKPD